MLYKTNEIYLILYMSNLYELLGVANDADESQIKKAYRTLSLKYHPDRNSSEEATAKFQQINEAYETLKDPELRKKHDMQGAMNENFNFNDADNFNDINNIFNMMFNGMHPGMPGMHGSNHRVNIFQNGQPGHFHTQFKYSNRIETINKQISISLDQCYNGCVYPIHIERTITKNNETEQESETIYVNIPSGINSGETIVLHEHGNIFNSIKGPVHINIQVSKHDIFIRDGLDLILNKQISLKESLCGFIIEINHLNGKKFSINNTTNVSVIKPNFKKIFQGLGMKRETTNGNLIVNFTIEFPDELTTEQIELLKTTLP
jgi:DnaJ-class molecular chaperone